ncbi:hypothetical protein D3C81_1673630 [compost metagenome]
MIHLAITILVIDDPLRLALLPMQNPHSAAPQIDIDDVNRLPRRCIAAHFQPWQVTHLRNQRVLASLHRADLAHTLPLCVIDVPLTVIEPRGANQRPDFLQLIAYIPMQHLSWIQSS